MLAGQKGKEQGIFNYLPALRAKKGFTLVEIIVTAFILSIVFAGLFITLNTTEFSHSVSSAKVDLQAEVRRVIDWIIKDVRQTVSYEVASNGPSDTHIKFKRVQGLNTVTGDLILSSDYIEYEYDSLSQKITRRVIDGATGDILQSWDFNNIIEAPFYTRDDLNNIVPLNDDDFTNYGNKFIVTIMGQKQVRGSLNINFTLTEEVKIRNG